MKELRPLGSEKLSGDDKLKRILELTYWGNNIQKKSSVDKPEFVTESKNGGVYGIVKEKDGFYVKKGLNENTLEYIGGMFMKNKNRFSSYGEAYKRLDFLKGQDILQEATKYVLKQNKPPMESPTPAPAMNEPVPDMGNSDIPPIPTGDEPSPEDEIPMGDEGEKNNLRSGYMEAIQKWSGKLGQELRDQKERLESDDIKYVLNMVISAIDLQKLDDEDLEDVASKFDRDEEEFEDSEGEQPSEDEFNDVPPQDDQELNEFDDDEPMSKLSDFINSSPEDDDSNIFSDFAFGNEEEEMNEYYYSGEDDDHDEMKHGLKSVEDFMNSDSEKHSYLSARSSENEDPEYNDGYEDEDIDNLERDEVNMESKPRRPKFRTKSIEEVTPTPTHKTKELDINELTDAVNRMIKDNLSKYFE